MVRRNTILLGIGTILLVLIAASLTAQSKPTLAKPALQSTTAATAAATEEANPCASAMGTATPVAASASAATPEGTQEAVEIPRPSNPGGPGPALKLVGDPKAGAQIFVDNCQNCHGEQGQGGVKNPGSDDGTVPSLNPIDPGIVDPDPKVFACNVDLFVEHGSVPSCPGPQQTMQPWGDNKQLTDQQIADVIAYVMSLNPVQAATPAATASK